MKAQCGQCGTRFEAKTQRARFCSASCRGRAHRAAAGVVKGSSRRTVKRPRRRNFEQHPLVVAVRSELEEAEALESVQGQIALQLARRLADLEEPGAASLSTQLRAAMQALAQRPHSRGGVNDGVTRARKARDEARRRAGLEEG